MPSVGILPLREPPTMPQGRRSLIRRTPCTSWKRAAVSAKSPSGPLSATSNCASSIVAIAEARERLAAAKASEARAADRQKAEEARKLVKELGDCFPYLDRKLAEAANALIAINDGIQKLHGLGFASPTDNQARLNICAIIETWAMRLPKHFHNQLRDGVRFLAPHERKTGVQYWTAIELSLQNQIAQRLGKTEPARVKEEAA